MRYALSSLCQICLGGLDPCILCGNNPKNEVWVTVAIHGRVLFTVCCMLLNVPISPDMQVSVTCLLQRLWKGWGILIWTSSSPHEDVKQVLRIPTTNPFVQATPTIQSLTFQSQTRSCSTPSWMIWQCGWHQVRSNDFVFKIKMKILGILLSYKYSFLLVNKTYSQRCLPPSWITLHCSWQQVRASDFVFKTKLNVFGILWSCKYIYIF